jgi:hypothetical protein
MMLGQGDGLGQAENAVFCLNKCLKVRMGFEQGFDCLFNSFIGMTVDFQNRDNAQLRLGMQRQRLNLICVFGISDGPG